MMLRRIAIALIILSAGTMAILMLSRKPSPTENIKPGAALSKAALELPWIAPDSSKIPHTAEGDLILYGKSIISNTAAYFGPGGRIAHISNGMNCQNCHLQAGAKPWGNNYGGVYSTYPKFRERRGAVETIYQRISDCFNRSLNGQAPDSNSHEMRAIMAYIQWLGQEVPRGKKPLGAGIASLAFLDRPADPQKGKIVYLSDCQRCHGMNGEGSFYKDSIEYKYPPLWGMNSYNTGAGLFRLSRFAGYVKDNMPFGISHGQTQLSDAQAWDVAAYVNAQSRPSKVFKQDWPDISLKPFDHPFGPFADSFSVRQHKYGPFGPILKAKEKAAAKNKH